ncbi:MAG: MBL fold metallo-hydrolase [Spirochaetia bacterium]|nr:MBL fold metallo-hydrolase [Spirochaetia bacterium]
MPEEKVRMQFLGATGYVTGSRTLMETKDTRIYVDAGLYQGQKYIEEKNYEPLETDSKKIHAIFLTHAHIDHSGLIPLLVKKGFTGKIFCTPGTKDLLEILLPDAGRLQEEEFRFIGKKKIIEYQLDGPLFNEEDAINSLQYIETVQFNEKIAFRDFFAQFYWAGHILGAANLQLETCGKTFLFSGDIGPRNTVIHKARCDPPGADYIIMESTYGDRLHEEEDFSKKMLDAVNIIIRRKGVLLIPAFAVGRTQLILYVIYCLIKGDNIPHLPVFIDSPMATKATLAYLKYPEEIHKHIIDEKFFEFIKSREIHLIEDVVSSKRLNYFNGPAIIISASGMCSGGRIMHHLFNRIWDRRNLILFVGYQAQGTLGRKIVDGSTRVKIFNRELPVRASLRSIDSFSAHADQAGLVDWLSESCKKKKPQTVFIIHGEEDSRIAFKEYIKFIDPQEIVLPKSEEIFYL